MTAISIDPASSDAFPEQPTLTSHQASRRSARSRRRRASHIASAPQTTDADVAAPATLPRAGDEPPHRPLQPSSHGVFKALKKSFPGTLVRLLKDNPKANQKNETNYARAMARESSMPPGQPFTVRQYLESNTVSDLRYDYARGYLELGQLTALAAAAPPYLVALLSPTLIPQALPLRPAPAPSPDALPALLASAHHAHNTCHVPATDVDAVFTPYAVSCSRLVPLPSARLVSPALLAKVTADTPPSPLNPNAPV